MADNIGQKIGVVLPEFSRFKSSRFVFQLYRHHLIINKNSDIDMHVFVVQPWYVLQPDAGIRV